MIIMYCKVKQKISGQFKILNTTENFSILISIIGNAIKIIQNVVGEINVIAIYEKN